MAPVSATSDTVTSNEQEKSNVIRFNVTKNELYKLDDGYKTLMRRQKGYFKIVTNTQSITSDTFTSSRVFVLAGPREKFTENEFDHLRRYLETGGSILVLLGEGGEKRQFVRFLYHISSDSFRGNYSFLNLALCTVNFGHSA